MLMVAVATLIKDGSRVSKSPDMVKDREHPGNRSNFCENTTIYWNLGPLIQRAGCPAWGRIPQGLNLLLKEGRAVSLLTAKEGGEKKGTRRCDQEKDKPLQSRGPGRGRNTVPTTSPCSMPRRKEIAGSSGLEVQKECVSSYRLKEEKLGILRERSD